MAKTSNRSGARRIGRAALPPPPNLKLFRAVSWHDRFSGTQAGEFVSHLLRETGRLGLRVRDIERHDRPPNTQTVLSDLICWLEEHPGQAFARLVNWQALDLSQMKVRLQENRAAKPRIELCATISKMNNLSVRWYPGGWQHAYHVFDTGYDHRNLVKNLKWLQPPDFWSFLGDEEPTFTARASNELMYLRGVGNLRPEPRKHRDGGASPGHHPSLRTGSSSKPYTGSADAQGRAGLSR